MQHIKNDTLVEIGTFLARRWSGRGGVTVGFGQDAAGARVRDGRIVLPPMEGLAGDGFQKYRQFRVMLWYESMRLRFCKKIQSDGHAFGFILNALETKRIEREGRKIWRGMGAELAFGYACRWVRRPRLDSIYGKARMVEGFYQDFMFRSVKGDIGSRQMQRIVSAARIAQEISGEAARCGYGTEWFEGRIPQIIRTLEIDSLLTVPVALPWSRPSMPLTEEELLKAAKKISKNMEELGSPDPRALVRGEEMRAKYAELVEENRRGGSVPGPGQIGVRTPAGTAVDETLIYDPDLIAGLKTRFKDWKSGLREEHAEAGDEFDSEAYVEGHKPFLTDVKKMVNTEITMLLDHSSSISGSQTEYKKATLALCEVLAYLKVRFAVYAFSTAGREVVCWQIKPVAQRWNNVCAKRLAQIAANGSTPLAEVYRKMHGIIESARPRIFLTLTDGEPADADAVRQMIRSFRGMGIGMVAIGLGPDTVRATTIASNLKHLGYDRTLAVGRLNDIPGKVLGVLGGA